MIPDLGAFPASWLADAELSLTVGRPERVGLSFFSTDRAAYAAFCTSQGVPLDDDVRLRGRFDLAPRHWLKLHYVGGECVGWSQYFAIHERNAYPITTLRLFARQYGAQDVARLEPTLLAALEHEESSWIVTVKRGEPRISCRMPRVLLPSLMRAAVAEAYLDPARADAYLECDGRLHAGSDVWVTMNPAGRSVGCLDFEDVETRSLPAGWEQVAAVPPRYLKCRLHSGTGAPEWVVYVPAAS